MESMEPITGSASLTQEPQRIAEVTPQEAFFGIAENLMPGVQLLVNAPSSPAMAMTLLSGHILECLLKAFLSKTGITKTDLRQRFGHNLHKLWKKAEKRGLPIPPKLSPCAATLHALHNHPFRLRYNPEHAHGLGLPNAQQLLSELTDLLEMVRQKIRP